jgi:hypothetical protein
VDKVPPIPDHEPAPPVNTQRSRRRIFAAVGAGIAVVAFGIVLGINATGSSAPPSSPRMTPCGQTGAMCPVDSSSTDGGQSGYSGAGDAVITSCRSSYPFGNGSLSVIAGFSVTDHDTVSHEYQVEIQGWLGFGAQPHTERLTVGAGQTVSGMATWIASNAATPNEPAPQAACQVLQTLVTN